MGSNTYWKKREAEALKRRLTDEKEYDKQVKAIYQSMLDNCQKEIESFYAKYAAAEGISLSAAKRRVSKLDIAAYERKAAKYVKEKNFSDKANAEMRLYNATMKINRLELLKANIGAELVAGHDELDKFMGEILKGRTLDELQRQAGILGKTIRNNAKAADSIVNASFHNANFSDRIWMYQDMLRSELSSLLQSGMIRGKNPRVLARELQKTFQASTANAERLMRTEMARVQTEAQKQSFERNGFEDYEFIANGSCCDICAGLNGKHFKVAKMMPGENAPPMHPNCRCSVAAWEDDAGYEAWLDHLDKGGTTAEWNKLKNGFTKSRSSGIMKLGSRYLNKTDDLYERAAKIKPLNGFYDIVAHGDQSGIAFKDANGNESTVSAVEFAKLFEQDKNYHGGNIRLVSCQTGAGYAVVPQYLADYFGVDVMAPTEIVNVDFNGNIILADDDGDAAAGIETGEWITFHPRKSR